MLDKTLKPRLTITPRIVAILAVAALLIGSLLLLSSPIWIFVLFFLGYSCTRHTPKAVRFVAVLLVSVAVALFLRFAGFSSDALDRAQKYDAEVWPGFKHVCVAPALYDTTRSIGNHDESEPLKPNEVIPVGSSSNGIVWFAGPACHKESKIRLVLSWMFLAMPAIYGIVLIRGRKRDGIPEQELIST